MLDQALSFLLDTVFSIITYGFLLRFVMQWLRAPFRNPLGQAVIALTDWAAKPLRRVVPGFRGLDISTLVLAWLARFLWLVALALLVGPGSLSGNFIAMFALLACVKLVEAMLWLLIIVVFAQASPDEPATLRAQVTSKRGTTERAITVLEGGDVAATIVDAVKAAAERARELGDAFGSDT